MAVDAGGACAIGARVNAVAITRVYTGGSLARARGVCGRRRVRRDT